MNKKVFIVVAHTDDEAFGMGGTIYKHVINGDLVYAMAMTDGVSSRQNTDNNKITQRKSAALESSNYFGFKWIKFNQFPDNKLDSIPLLNLVKEIEEVKLNLQPNLIYTHASADLNIDHRLVNQAVMTAFRPQNGEIYDEIRTFEVPSSTEYGHKSVTQQFSPNLYIDITDFIEKKIEGIKNYFSEIRNYPHPRSLESIKNLAKYRGNQVGLFYAESFEVLRKIER